MVPCYIFINKYEAVDKYIFTKKIGSMAQDPGIRALYVDIPENIPSGVKIIKEI